MGKKVVTQKDRILVYMDIYGSISPYEAFMDLGITKLASRISEMIRDGEKIEKIPETGKNRFGEPVTFMRYRKAV